MFIDWSQNNGSKTTIRAPLAARSRQAHGRRARTWEELDDPGLRHLLFHEVLERTGDPARRDRPRGGPLRATYIAKRTAGRTPEPVPDVPHAEAAGDGLPRFVIQEHHASRLHWDLRSNGTALLVSWAVPRGVPPTTGRNSLAVMTEDHPMQYLDFAGARSRARQYGAGTMTVWTPAPTSSRSGGRRGHRDTHRSARRPARARAAGLIRTEGAGEKSQWLLHG